MSNKETLGKQAASGLLRFIVGLIMFLILAGITFLVMGAAVFEFIHMNMKTPAALTLGIVASLIYALIVYLIPYLRKIGTVRWFAYCALMDAAWWAYLLFTE